MIARAYIVKRAVSIVLVTIIGIAGYAFTSAIAADAPQYDLTIDNMPVNFTAETTMRLDTQTNDRAFVIYEDHLRIRSQYLTFWDFNETYDHEDVNLVTGAYAYAVVPAMNLTLNSITEINRFQLSSWNGTVSVRCSEYGINRMTLLVNSSDNATLLIRAVDLSVGYEYRVLIDGAPTDWVRANWHDYFEYNYTGSWSNHTITFVLISGPTLVPQMYLYLIQVFLILGVFIAVSKKMILPLRHKELKPNETMKNLFQAAIYIAVSMALITIVFHMFVGV